MRNRVFPHFQSIMVFVFISFSIFQVIQRRSDGSVDFHQKMAEYQAGFGNLEGEFWLGLDNIYKFVSTDVYQLRIDLTNYRHVSKHATYSEFAISDESDGYRLHLGKYSGNARE